MGDSRWYYSPMLEDGALNVGSDFDDGELEKITVPAGSTLCEPYPTGEPAIPVSGLGTSYSVSKGDRGMNVRIRASLGNDSDLAEALMAMVSFAKEGGVVGFALDTDFAWAVQVEADILSGDGDFDYPPSFVEGWESVSDPESGWRCHVQSPLPQLHRETIKLDTVAAGNATLVEDFVFAHAVQNWNVLVRHKFFFPFLRYLSGDVLVQDGGGFYFFDVVFFVDVGLEHTPIEVADPNFPQALLDAAVALGTLNAFWIMNDGATSIGTSETIMTDASATSSRVMKSALASSGNWERDTTDKPPGFPGSINTKTNRGNTNYMGLDAAAASSAAVVMFVKVETPQGGGDYTMLGSTGGTVGSPQADIDVFAVWSGPAPGTSDIYYVGDGGGNPGAHIAHGDYTDWVVLVFTRDPQVFYASTVGGTWKDLGIGSYAGGAGWGSDWTGYNAFYAGSGPGRETGSGTVKHAGLMFFSDEPVESDIQQMLIDGGIITA